MRMVPDYMVPPPHESEVQSKRSGMEASARVRQGRHESRFYNFDRWLDPWQFFTRRRI